MLVASVSSRSGPCRPRRSHASGKDDGAPDRPAHPPSRARPRHDLDRGAAARRGGAPAPRPARRRGAAARRRGGARARRADGDGARADRGRAARAPLPGRRGVTDEPLDELEVDEALKRAAVAAAVAAGAGALVGAAKAYLGSRTDDGADRDEDEVEQHDEPAARTEGDGPRDATLEP